jgi:hypothetical protein
VELVPANAFQSRDLLPQFRILFPQSLYFRLSDFELLKVFRLDQVVAAPNQRERHARKQDCREERRRYPHLVSLWLMPPVLIVRLGILVVAAFVMGILLPLIMPAVGLAVLPAAVIRPARAAVLGLNGAECE